VKFGVITDCLKLPLAEAIPLAAKMGFSGVQIYATSGEFSPETLTEEQKSRYKALLADCGLEVSALCGDMGGYGFEITEDNAERIEKTKKIIDLAVEFGTKVVTTHIGVIPSDKNHERYSVMLEALTECGLYAKSRGVTLAIETGPEKATVLKGFVESTKGGVGVNLDPANFVMVTEQDPAEAVYLLKDYIVHTHLKDGVKLNSDMTPEEVYHAFAVGGVDALNACEGFSELPIGTGAVDWKEYIAALKDIGYSGYLTVEREAGENPEEDIMKGLKFIQGLI
jgi:sugar phosphate isomerase/epimerase